MNNHMKTKLPSTPAEFVQWVETHINAGDKYFWNATELDDADAQEKDVLYLWRNSIFRNTVHTEKPTSLAILMLLYHEGCDLFGKEEFEHDMQQFYDDNI